MASGLPRPETPQQEELHKALLVPLKDRPRSEGGTRADDGGIAAGGSAGRSRRTPVTGPGGTGTLNAGLSTSSVIDATRKKPKEVVEEYRRKAVVFNGLLAKSKMSREGTGRLPVLSHPNAEVERRAIEMLIKEEEREREQRRKDAEATWAAWARQKQKALRATRTKGQSEEEKQKEKDAREKQGHDGWVRWKEEKARQERQMRQHQRRKEAAKNEEERKKQESAREEAKRRFAEFQRTHAQPKDARLAHIPHKVRDTRLRDLEANPMMKKLAKTSDWAATYTHGGPSDGTGASAKGSPSKLGKTHPAPGGSRRRRSVTGGRARPGKKKAAHGRQTSAGATVGGGRGSGSGDGGADGGGGGDSKVSDADAQVADLFAAALNGDMADAGDSSAAPGTGPEVDGGGTASGSGDEYANSGGFDPESAAEGGGEGGGSAKRRRRRRRKKRHSAVHASRSKSPPRPQWCSDTKALNIVEEIQERERRIKAVADRRLQEYRVRTQTAEGAYGDTAASGSGGEGAVTGRSAGASGGNEWYDIEGRPTAKLIEKRRRQAERRKAARAAAEEAHGSGDADHEGQGQRSGARGGDAAHSRATSTGRKGGHSRGRSRGKRGGRGGGGGGGDASDSEAGAPTTVTSGALDFSVIDRLPQEETVVVEDAEPRRRAEGDDGGDGGGDPVHAFGAGDMRPRTGTRAYETTAEDAHNMQVEMTHDDAREALAGAVASSLKKDGYMTSAEERGSQGTGQGQVMLGAGSHPASKTKARGAATGFAAARSRSITATQEQQAAVAQAKANADAEAEAGDGGDGGDSAQTPARGAGSDGSGAAATPGMYVSPGTPAAAGTSSKDADGEGDTPGGGLVRGASFRSQGSEGSPVNRYGRPMAPLSPGAERKALVQGGAEVGTTTAPDGAALDSGIRTPAGEGSASDVEGDATAKAKAEAEATRDEATQQRLDAVKSDLKAQQGKDGDDGGGGGDSDGGDDEAAQAAAAVRIQSVSRGKRDRERVAAIKADKDREAAEAEAKAQEQAATKMQAVARGKADRARVESLKQQKSKAAGASASSPAKSGPVPVIQPKPEDTAPPEFRATSSKEPEVTPTVVTGADGGGGEGGDGDGSKAGTRPDTAGDDDAFAEGATHVVLEASAKHLHTEAYEKAHSPHAKEASGASPSASASASAGGDAAKGSAAGSGAGAAPADAGVQGKGKGESEGKSGGAAGKPAAAGAAGTAGADTDSAGKAAASPKPEPSGSNGGAPAGGAATGTDDAAAAAAAGAEGKTGDAAAAAAKPDPRTSSASTSSTVAQPTVIPPDFPLDAIPPVTAIHAEDIAELRAYKKPPKSVITVIGAICVLLDERPTWKVARKVMASPDFVSRLVELDPLKLPSKSIHIVRKLIVVNELEANALASNSRGTIILTNWVVSTVAKVPHHHHKKSGGGSGDSGSGAPAGGDKAAQ